MLKETELETYNIVQSKTSVHFSLHGLDNYIITIKEW